ncbi:hypothetical protein ACIBTP_20940 [Streptomyces avidinii]
MTDPVRLHRHGRPAGSPRDPVAKAAEDISAVPGNLSGSGGN